MDIIPGARQFTFSFSGVGAAGATIGRVDSGATHEIAGWTSGRAVAWVLRADPANVDGLDWKRGTDVFAGEDAGPPVTMANFETLAGGDAHTDRWLMDGDDNQALHIRSAGGGNVAGSGHVIVIGG